MTSVAVVRGGRSLEREISLRSGHHVANALRHLGHDAHEVDVDEQLTSALQTAEAVFIALHGRDGEDGTIQLIAEALGMPYTGSPPMACHLCFDKGLAKGVLQQAGVPTPPGYVLSAEAVRRMGAGSALRHAADELGSPIVVKPAAQGSALGFVRVDAAEDLSSAVMTAFNYGDRVMLERFVDGAELIVPVFGADLAALPAVEIRTSSGVFDFQARVSPGAADYLCPAELDEAVLGQVAEVATRTARVLGVDGFGRIDMRVGAEGPVVLDVKTCPGLTESSLVPLSVSEAGLSFEEFVGGVLEGALRGSSARAQ